MAIGDFVVPMPKLVIRLSYADVYGGELKEKLPAKVLNEKFLRFEAHSARDCNTNNRGIQSYFRPGRSEVICSILRATQCEFVQIRIYASSEAIWSVYNIHPC